MARAAFLMDRLMAGVGLSGKSFIPLLSSFACAIPGIMATRDDRKPPRPAGDDSHRAADELLGPAARVRDSHRRVRAGRAIPGRPRGLQGLTLLAMYAVGVVVAIGVAWVLKRTILRGETPPFVLELPSYKLPSLRNVLYRMAERGWSFVARAGPSFSR